jgi:hypothetical protein
MYFFIGGKRATMINVVGHKLFIQTKNKTARFFWKTGGFYDYFFKKFLIIVWLSDLTLSMLFTTISLSYSLP